MLARRSKQLELPTHGGKREGAGRKPRPGRRNVAHRSRPVFLHSRALHVTLRMAKHVYSLRSRRSQAAVEHMLRGADRFGVRVVQMSVQGDHIHMLVEAPDSVSLRRAVTGLSVRLAHGMNRMMGLYGRVIGDRYHSRLLKTPTEVRHVMHYIRFNQQHHAAGRGQVVAAVDMYSSDGVFAGFLPAATLWLLGDGLLKAPRSHRSLR